MAERTPLPSDETHILRHDNDDYDDPRPDPFDNDYNANCYPAATYVVQVPKDQIYRVPPPENATKKAARAKRAAGLTPCAARCCCGIFILAAVLLLLGLAVSLFSAALRPKLPTFHVERIDADNALCRVLLRSDNPNARLDISYGGAGGGVVSLRLGKSEIAAGKFPGFYHAHGSSTAVEILLLYKRWPWPKEIEKAARLVLKMNGVAARTEVWTWDTGSVKLDVACDVAVDSLVPRNRTTRVLSQECRTTKRD